MSCGAQAWAAGWEEPRYGLCSLRRYFVTSKEDVMTSVIGHHVFGWLLGWQPKLLSPCLALPAPHGQHGHLGECDYLTLNITPACRQDCCSAWFPGRRGAEFGLQSQAHGGFEMHTTSAPRPYLACLGTMQHGHERGQCVTAQGIPEVESPLNKVVVCVVLPVLPHSSGLVAMSWRQLLG